MKLIRLSLMCLLGGTIISSCVKQKFDAPPDTSQYDPHLTTNSKVFDFASSGINLQVGQSRVLGDSIFDAFIVADDRSGNLYKKIVVQDSAGYGMSLILDKTYLYGDYPVGRHIYVKTKGLVLLNYKGVPELVYSINPDNTTTGIPTSLITSFIVKGSYPNAITPITVDILSLFSDPSRYVNTLIKIDNMQFDNSSAGVVYSSPYTSTNRTITNCDHSASLVMYNSSYATFQPAITPTGNGSITGIFSVYISTPQFTLRDTTDVNFTAPRCP
jgi:hypothetical protein